MCGNATLTVQATLKKAIKKQLKLDLQWSDEHRRVATVADGSPGSQSE